VEQLSALFKDIPTTGLEVDRVLGALGVQDDRAGCSWYREHMQKRVLEISLSDTPQEFDSAWEKIRRGWYFGRMGSGRS
jgi:hypothetical protein